MSYKRPMHETEPLESEEWGGRSELNLPSNSIEAIAGRLLREVIRLEEPLPVEIAFSDPWRAYGYRVTVEKGELEVNYVVLGPPPKRCPCCNGTGFERARHGV